ncbi:DUF6036 family nucleotidyltransferase [Promicromonospora sp. Populi]|uniref:DUF6036 family nucleotidyltransferase n=1 Tax=Promicromonospora sp. Populi TaxID=3239420 RepID=UPI0034E2AAA4
MNGNHAGFNADQIRQLLTELGERLGSNGFVGELYIVGGSAMALAYDRDRLTRDIDAVYAPKSEVFAEAQRMAAERDELDDGWLNDAMKGFLTANPDNEARVVLTTPGLTVLVASARRLLAMKILAARAERDSDDILTLCRHAGVKSIEEVLAIAESEYGNRLEPKSKFLAIELLQDHLPMSLDG